MSAPARDRRHCAASACFNKRLPRWAAERIAEWMIRGTRRRFPPSAAPDTQPARPDPTHDHNPTRSPPPPVNPTGVDRRARRAESTESMPAPSGAGQVRERSQFRTARPPKDGECSECHRPAERPPAGKDLRLARDRVRAGPPWRSQGEMAGMRGPAEENEVSVCNIQLDGSSTASFAGLTRSSGSCYNPALFTGPGELPW